MHYIEVVASMHATQNSSLDFLFPNVTVKKHVLTLKDTPVRQTHGQRYIWVSDPYK